MALSLIQQLQQTLSQTRNVLVVCRPQPSHDEIAAVLAVAELVKQAGKQVVIVSENYIQPSALKFIPETANTISGSVGQLHDFIISLDIGPTGVQNVHHELVDGQLTIHVTPNVGVVTPAQIGMRSSEFRYDAIIVVGAQDLSSLGSTYSNNTALFNAAPVINIDRSPANEQFGHINIVDITCTSVAEVVHMIFNEARADIKQPIANLLLTGMIAATQSFKLNSVNARTLQTASALIALGADRELIVQHLYRQRSVAALKLWGAVLSHLQTDPQQPLMWSTLTREDFARAGANEHDLNDLIDELIYTAPNVKVFSLIYERPEKPEEICVVVDAQKPYIADVLSSGFSHTTGTTSRTRSVLDGYTLGDGTQRVVNVLRAKMRG